MSSNRLQDDLLQEFKEQKKTNYELIELLDPLATSLRKPAAQRVLSKSALIFSEILLYLLALGVVAFAVFMDKIYPFYLITDMRARVDYQAELGSSNIQMMNIALYGIVIFIGVLFYFFGRMIRRIRLKNDILNLAGKNIKYIVSEHLKRKAALDTIEQRHFDELPNRHLEEEEENVDVNDVANPGF